MILFFIRKYNDVDHITPIIYKFAQRNKPLMVLSLNPSFPIKDDYRLKYLAENFGVKIKYIYEVFCPTFLHRVFAKLLCGTGVKKQGENLVSYILRIGYNKLLPAWVYEKYLKELVYTEEWAEGLYKEFKPEVAVFDWIKPRQYVAKSLLKAANKLSIPTVSVPHGIPMFINDFFTVSQAETQKKLDYGNRYKRFDHYVVQFPMLKDIVTKSGLPTEKVHVLGSTRFCDEWQQVHKKWVEHVSKYKELNGKGHLKVVFMDTLPMYRINVDVVVDSLQRLSKLDGLELLIKPHTRSNNISTIELGKAAKIVNKVPSGVLCAWADVIIGTSSSILLEAYRLNKVLLYPKFFHANTMLFEKYDACWKVETQKALEDALKQLVQSPSFRPYTKKAVQNVLTEVVCGGVENRDVLQTYTEFIEAIGNKKIESLSGHGNIPLGSLIK